MPAHTHADTHTGHAKSLRRVCASRSSQLFSGKTKKEEEVEEVEKMAKLGIRFLAMDSCLAESFVSLVLLNITVY